MRVHSAENSRGARSSRIADPPTRFKPHTSVARTAALVISTREPLPRCAVNATVPKLNYAHVPGDWPILHTTSTERR